MKLNWINLVATILILGGVVLLVGRKMGKSTVPMPASMSVEDAKKDVIGKMEKQMGRKLNDAELQMIEATRDGDRIKVVLHPPLSGRFAEAWRASQIAEGKTPTTQGSIPTAPPNATVEVAPMPTTAP
jgi:hypothetical protein